MQITGPGIWGEPADRAGAVAVVRAAVEQGVDFIDTADSYGPFVSEQIIAEALHPYARRSGRSPPRRAAPGTGPHDWTPWAGPAYLKQQVELSLRTLKLERIDLIQLHRIDPEVPLADQLGAFKELQEQGKVRHIGALGGVGRGAEGRPRDRRRRQRAEPLQPDQPEVAGRPGLRHRREHRVHPVVPDRHRRPRRARQPGGRDRRGARRDPGAGGAGLAAAEVAGRAAHPGDEVGRAPDREPRRGRGSRSPPRTWTAWTRWPDVRSGGDLHRPFPDGGGRWRARLPACPRRTAAPGRRVRGPR